MRKTRSTNPELVRLIGYLKKKGREKEAAIWRDIAERLAKLKRKNIVVNLSRLNRYTKKSEMVAVPGKVLAAGEIHHPIVVAAFAFSEKAVEKIGTANGKCLSLYELVEENPAGSNVKILG